MPKTIIRLAALAGAGAFFFAAQAAQATAIVFTETVLAAGDLDGTGFTDAVVTFVGRGNTTNVVGHSQISHIPLSVNVSGVGSDTFTDDFLLFANDMADNSVGFGDTTNGFALLYTDGPIGGYDLKSDFSLKGGSSKDLGKTYNTMGGTFSFSGTAETATFSAQLVPEPATWALMIMGFGLAGATLRRRSVAAVRA